MEKREIALREALDKNAYETERWEAYIKENAMAIENLDKFSQHLSVDVMVPVGKKMLMPGKLIHTNEVLVGHFQGYFSKCSAKKATEICDLRIKKAKQHLNELNVEGELWLNNLEKPYVEGVMATGHEQEIIEEYNEEREKEWRETHKINMRDYKLREKQERNNIKENKNNSELGIEDESNIDVLKILEERELMEELEEELENLEIDNISDETVKQIMSGNLNIPSDKKRIAHQSMDHADNLNTKQSQNEKKTVNSLNLKTHNLNVDEELHEDDDEEDEEFLKIKKQLKYLAAEDQENFLECQIKIIKQKLQELKLQNMDDLIEKTRLYSLLDDMHDILGCIGELEQDDDQHIERKLKEPISPMVDKTVQQQKRRISFALNDETLEFRGNEAVTQLLPHNTRDKIILNENLTISKSPIIPHHPNKKELIRNRVENNLKYVYENQSAKDLDIIDNIISESETSPFPICINFQHYGNTKSTEITNDVPTAPSDFYKNYVKIKEQQNEKPTAISNVIYVDGYKGENEVHVPVLREADYNKSYKKPIHEFSKSDGKVNNLPIGKKLDKAVSKKNLPTKQANDDEEFSAYAKVVGDVIDKTFPDNGSVEGVPDPLPNQNFVDAHAPKKRISRFRQSREACKASS